LSTNDVFTSATPGSLAIQSRTRFICATSSPAISTRRSMSPLSELQRNTSGQATMRPTVAGAGVRTRRSMSTAVSVRDEVATSIV
jgi:hypothetical protein